MKNLSLREKVFLFSILLFFCLLFVPYFNRGAGSNMLTVYGFLLIISCSLWYVFADRLPYSFNKIFWIFNLIFLGVIPCLQFLRHKMPWGLQFQSFTFIKANALILAGMGMYLLLKRFVGYLPVTEKKAPDIQILTHRYKTVGTVLLFMAAAGIMLLYGIKNIWLRNDLEAAGAGHNSSFLLLADKSLRGVMLFLSMLAVLLYRDKKISLFHLLFLLIVCVLANFPLSLPRFFAATLYAGLLLCFDFAFLKRKHAFSAMLIGGILMLFPLLSFIRYKESQKARIHSFADVIGETLNYGDFDAYTSLCRAIEFVEKTSATAGYQLLGALLFFIPRSIWPTKPIGSGAFMSGLGEDSFRNFSCTLYAEGYVNFGMIGSILFIAVFALLANLYDNYYWKQKNDDVFVLSFGMIFYPAAMIMSFYMLRGDLMSSFAYLIGFIVPGYVLHAILTKPVKVGKPKF